MFMKNAIADPGVKPEARFAQMVHLLELTWDCVFVLDRNWRFIFLNHQAEAEILAGQKVFGRHILEVFPQLEETTFWPAYQSVMLERKPCRIESFMPGLDHWYEAHAAPLDDGIAVFFRNIDERKSAEEALQGRETQLRSTLNHIPQMVWSTLANGHHDYYNSHWYNFTGIAEGSTGGEGWNDVLHPDDQEQSRIRWRYSLSSGDPYEIEYRLRHHTGEYRWVLVRAFPKRNERGETLRWYGTCTDIHDRVLALEALDETRGLQDGILDASADCIKVILPDGTLQFINDPGIRAMELESLDTARGRDWISFWPKKSQAAAQQAFNDALSDRPARFTGFCPTALGKPKWWDVVVTPIKGERGEITRVLSISRDVTAQRRTTRQLQWSSEHDDLTGLPNRRAFHAHVEAATIRAMESGGEVVLLLVDLDHFKHLNDSHGHIAGDHFLIACGQRLRRILRPTDFVARLGGDEFAIVLEGKLSTIDLDEMGQTIVERLRQPVPFVAQYISAGTSIGGSAFPRDANSATELIKHADIALYSMKNNGRGGAVLYNAQMGDDAQQISSQLSMARVALSEETVEPYYQQKAVLKSGQIAGLEALLRWHHATGGLQYPDTVSEAFKDYELAAKIGDLMQRKVFHDLRCWLDQSLPVGFVAINAAPAEFLRDDFAERLLGRMREFSIPPSLIEIEITEQALLDHGADFVGRALKVLNEAGVRIALDDFGTGHSSLSHLRDYPVDVLKIDKSFVQGLSSDTEVRAITLAVIDLAHSLKIDVVAEGIETELQKNLLIEDGCLLGQGFYFGEAVEAKEIPFLLASRRSQVAA